MMGFESGSGGLFSIFSRLITWVDLTLHNCSCFGKYIGNPVSFTSLISLSITLTTCTLGQLVELTTLDDGRGSRATNSSAKELPVDKDIKSLGKRVTE